MSFHAHTPPKDSNKWHPLKCHLFKVAKLAKKLASKFNAGELAYYAGLWHDLGKYNPEFQEYLKQCDRATRLGEKLPRKKVPHAVYGAILAEEECPFLAPIIQGHHSGIPEFEDLELEDAAEDSIWAETYEQIILSAEEEITNLYPTKDLEEYLDSLPQNPLFADVFYRLLFSCLIDADRLDTEKHDNRDRQTEKNKTNLRQSYNRQSLNKLWDIFEQKRIETIADNKSKSDASLNEIREEVYQACLNVATQKPGVFKLAVPTGGGKTFSSLGFALKHATEHEAKRKFDRVIVAVPYTSIINQTVTEYRKIFGYEAVLEHHSAIKKGDKDNEEMQLYKTKERLVAENWDAPLIVTTTIQLFESLFSNRPSKCRKMHNIVNSIIILDEVQTLPIKLLQPIVNMLEELVNRYNVSVVLCTATQPALDSISGYFQGFDASLMRDIIRPERSRQIFKQLKRVEYDISSVQQGNKWTWDELNNKLVKHEQALTIVNTRKDALELLERFEIRPEAHIRQQSPETEVKRILQTSKILHLSTLLCGAHRNAIIKEIERRLDENRPCVLISTQVVEAGMDFDFSTVYRALAPLDRIVQAAGRCNRTGKRSPEESIVYVFEGGSSPKGEYQQAISRTRSLLQDLNFDFHDPSIFQNYFENLYKSIDKKLGQEIEEEREKHNFPKVAKEFKLIKDTQVSVVIPYNQIVEKLLSDIDRRGWQRDDFQQLQPYVVSIPQWEFEKQLKADNVQVLGNSDSIFQLKQGLYHPILGIPFGQDIGDCNFLAECTV